MVRWLTYKPTLAKASTQLLPSLHTRVTKKFILLVMFRQLVHLFLSFRGTSEEFLKALTTKEESDSNHKFFHWYWWAISIALMAPNISAWKALPGPVFSSNQSSKTESLALKIPPQDEVVLLAEPSVLHLIHWKIRGCHKTSMILGVLGGWMQTLIFLRMVKSWIDEEATALDRLPERDKLEIIIEIVVSRESA